MNTENNPTANGQQFEPYRDYSKARDFEVQEEENKQQMTEARTFVLDYTEGNPEFEGHATTSTLAKMLVDFTNRKTKQGQLAHDAIQSIDLITDHTDLSDKQKLKDIEGVLEVYWNKTKPDAELP
jgi:hypothetical protein